jgi:hypothetical protein
MEIVAQIKFSLCKLLIRSFLQNKKNAAHFGKSGISIGEYVVSHWFSTADDAE